jgi:hypothetical protein
MRWSVSRWAVNHLIRFGLRRAVSHLLLNPQGLFDLQASLAEGDGVPPWPDFEDWCRKHPGSHCMIYVSGEFQYQISPPNDHPWPGTAQARAYGLQLLSHYHGHTAQEWIYAAWRSREHWGVSALHGVNPLELDKIAKSHRVHLMGMRPLWSGVGAHQVEAGASYRVLMLEGSLLTCVQFRSGQYAGVQQRRLISPTVDGLHAWLQSNSDSDTADIVCGYGTHGEFGKASPPISVRQMIVSYGFRQWWTLPPAKKFSCHPRWNIESTGTSLTVWFVIGLAAIGAVCTTVEAWMAWQAWHEADAELVKWTAAYQRQASSAPSRAIDAAVSLQTQTIEAADAARGVAQRLRYPWGDVLYSVEQATSAGVRWVSLEYKADPGELQIEGIAVDLQNSLLVAQVLARQSGWQDAALTRASLGHDVPGVRFELSARRTRMSAGGGKEDLR